MRRSTFIFLIQSLLVVAIFGVVFGEEVSTSTQASSSVRSPKASAASSVSDDALERAIKDSRYFNRQFACLAGEGPCDQVGRRLKEHLPCAIKGVNCSENSKDLRRMEKVKGHLINNHPDKWEKLVRNSQSAELKKHH